LKGVPTDLWSMAFAPDGKMLATAGGQWNPTTSGYLQLWEVETGKEIRRLGDYDTKVTAVAFSADGKQLAACSWDGSLRLWEANSGKELDPLITKEDRQLGLVTAIAFSPDGRYLSATGDRTRVWEMPSRNIATTFKWAGYGPPACLAFSPDSR